jgi:DNA-binding transcriptional ArsR family regulator
MEKKFIKAIIKAILSLDENNRNNDFFKTVEILKKLKEDKAFTYDRRSLRNQLNYLVENGYLEKKKEGRSNTYKLSNKIRDGLKKLANGEIHYFTILRERNRNYSPMHLEIKK